jgi:hypothetical protein
VPLLLLTQCVEHHQCEGKEAEQREDNDLCSMGADADAYHGNCHGNTEDEEQNDPGWRSSRWRRRVSVHAVSIVMELEYQGYRGDGQSLR